MGWIWITLIYEIVFTVIGVIFMLLPGKVAKFMAIPTFIFVLPMVVGRDTVWSISDSGAATYLTLSLPILYEGIRFNIHTMVLLLGIWNWFDELDRDLFFRKRR